MRRLVWLSRGPYSGRISTRENSFKARHPKFALLKILRRKMESNQTFKRKRTLDWSKNVRLKENTVLVLGSALYRVFKIYCVPFQPWILSRTWSRLSLSAKKGGRMLLFQLGRYNFLLRDVNYLGNWTFKVPFIWNLLSSGEQLQYATRRNSTLFVVFRRDPSREKDIAFVGLF